MKKGDAKGKRQDGSSSNTHVTPFFLVDDKTFAFFEEKCMWRLVVKQHVYKPSVVDGLHLPKVVNHVTHQGINYSLQLSQE